MTPERLREIADYVHRQCPEMLGACPECLRISVELHNLANSLPKPRVTLTERQKSVFEYIKSYIKRNGFGPSFHEIAAGIGIKSVSTVNKHVYAIADRGWITVEFNRSRSITILPDPDEANSIKND